VDESRYAISRFPCQLQLAQCQGDMMQKADDVLAVLQKHADTWHDGHFTICRFGSNWRVGFHTPNTRGEIDDMWPGLTLEAAARAAVDGDQHKRSVGDAEYDRINSDNYTFSQLRDRGMHEQANALLQKIWAHDAEMKAGCGHE
jgi:hypothetical protein